MPSEPLAPADSLFPEEPQSRRRGRPKGSKNRPKPASADAEPRAQTDPAAASGRPGDAAAPLAARAATARKAATARSVPKSTPAPKAPETLTKALSKLLAELTRDLRLALDANPEATRSFQAEHQTAREAQRTAEPYLDWLTSQLDQIAASWILSAVFVRFVEDNRLIDRPRLSGPLEPGPSGLSPFAEAKAAEDAHYDQHPGHGEAEYLAAVFNDLARLPGLADLLDQQHAALWRLAPRPEGARALLGFFRQQDAETGQLRWSFVDPELSTRFLGDLYQELSEFAQKRYALLQTPEFVERFLLDQTLEPALQDFGLEALRLIDPTCGSGHFLLGAFERLFERWQTAAPGEETRTLVARALAAVHGVDVNPFAIAIARFRLLVAANRRANVQRLAAAPNFKLNLAVGDSLLHGERFSELRGRQKDFTSEDKLAHVYPLELPEALGRILGQQYHVVVGNPPYITVKDPALNEAYRAKYGACSGKYSLSVPFLERFVELAVEAQPGQPAGYSGQITSNSFMKREFGQKVIEEYFPNWDLTHVIDTSGAYIPGHNTPTVILLIRNRRPVSAFVRGVFGSRGEPRVPQDPAKGVVWSELIAHLNDVGYESRWVSVVEVDRKQFSQHPWCVAGGGACELKELIEARTTVRLGQLTDSTGIVAVTGEDDFFLRGDKATIQRYSIDSAMALVEGDQIRDWSLGCSDYALWTYTKELEADCPHTGGRSWQELWRYRSSIQHRRRFGTPMVERGLAWWEWQELYSSKLRTPLSIAYAEIATHNHFVLDRGGKVFNRTAPVIKLPPDATEDDHFALLGVLNSSLGCFWGKQVYFPKGGDSLGDEGARVRSTAWDYFFAWDSTKTARFPLRPVAPDRARAVSEAAEKLQRLIQAGDSEDAAHAAQQSLVALQEELDWHVYRVFELADPSLELAGQEPPPVAPGERAFEIVHAREVAAGLEEPTWFERHGIQAVREVPGHWPEWYRALVERRIAAIQSDRWIGLMERPENKRRWYALDLDTPRLERNRQRALEAVESLLRSARDPLPLTVAAICEASATKEGAQDDPAGLLTTLRSAETLLEGEAVPFVAHLRFKERGLDKHQAWRETWRLQRVEDPYLEQQEQLLAEHFGSAPAEQRRAREHVACWKTSDKLSKEKGLKEAEVTRLQGLRLRWLAIEAERQRAIGGETPPVPPKYEPKDFRSPALWRQRGKLDVPKERFISYPHCSPDGDPSLLLGWAGWNHLKRAEALVQILEARKRAGWTGERLAPILLGLDELQFWLDKWHPDVAEEYQAFLEQETNQAGLTLAQVRAWTPPAKARGRKQKSPQD